jgi:hypothetical protein
VAAAPVQVEGARQLRASLKRAGVGVTELKAAHAEVAKLVEDRARPEAPRRSGRLAASMRSSGTQSAAVVRAGGAAVPYAGPIHFGWPARHITANPWILDAAEAARDSWENVYLSHIEDLIQLVEGAPGP